MKKFIIGCLFTLTTLGADKSIAAEVIDNIKYFPYDTWQMGFTMGSFLPRNISFGVQEKLAFSGVYLSYPTRLCHFEYMFLSGRGGDVTYLNGSARMRFDFRIYDVVNGYMALGADVHRYQRAPNNGYVYDFVNKTGIDGGFGFTGHITGPFYIRSDVKINIAPGKSVFVGIGLNYHFWSDSENKAEAN